MKKIKLISPVESYNQQTKCTRPGFKKLFWYYLYTFFTLDSSLHSFFSKKMLTLHFKLYFCSHLTDVMQDQQALEEHLLNSVLTAKVCLFFCTVTHQRYQKKKKKEATGIVDLLLLIRQGMLLWDLGSCLLCHSGFTWVLECFTQKSCKHAQQTK